MEVVIVSGISGAGKSHALRILEDFEYFCIDNLPLSLISQLISQLKNVKKVAISIDIRNYVDFDLGQIVDNPLIEKSTFLFLDASEKVIRDRYTESRRSHPVNQDQSLSISDAVYLERKILNRMRESADFIIDTSFYSPHDLAQHIKQALFNSEIYNSFKIFVYSFGFKYGHLNNVDFLFDLRSLPNPYWNKSIRGCTGQDQQVIDFLERYDEVKEYLQDVEYFLSNRIKQISNTNRLSLNIAFACNGGRHRSVYFAEKITEFLKQQNYNVSLVHQTIDY